MAFDWKDDAKWDAMWLDYIGPMTVERLQLISKFYQKHIEDVLILTTLKGRWNHATGRAVKEAGSYSVWLFDNLPGQLVHNIEYYDTSPMSQFAVRKPNLGQQTVDAHGRGAEIAAAGQKSLDAHSSHACGGTNSESLGHRFSDAQDEHAEIAAAGHNIPDAQKYCAGGGTLSEHLGHRMIDAHSTRAEIAAAGHAYRDAQAARAGGGTLPEHLGQPMADAHRVRAEIAAAGQSTVDAHGKCAGGGTPSEHLGQPPADAHIPSAGGGPSFSTQEKPMVNSSLKDALRNAGFDSAARELKAEAERFLQKNGTPERSIVGFLSVVRKDNDLLQAMALSYLRSVAAKMPLSAPESPENAARTWPAPKPRSEADKIASRGAMRAVTIDLRQQVMIDGQPIGKLSWHDLRHIGRERVLKAAELIGAGQQEIIKARLIALMVEHAQVTDENATVNDVISSELFAKLHKRAVKETPSITAAIIPEVARVSSQIIERISRPAAS